MSLPRVLTVGTDNRLRFRPIEELDTLRYDEKSLQTWPWPPAPTRR